MKSADLGNRPTHERIGRILAGLSVLAGLGLGLLSPWFLLIAAGTAMSLVISGITDRCLVKNLLVRMGLPGERDVGRAETLLSERTDMPAALRRRLWRSRLPVN